METINWVDNSGLHDAQSFKYETPYLLTDFILAFMFLRFYFFVFAIIMYSPVNDRLYGKRVCQNAGFEPNFTFQIKAGMLAAPIGTFFIMAVIMLFSLSYMIRLFERPYYTFNFEEVGVQF